MNQAEFQLLPYSYLVRRVKRIPFMTTIGAARNLLLKTNKTSAPTPKKKEMKKIKKRRRGEEESKHKINIDD